MSEAKNVVVPSALANRIKELVNQSRRYQDELAQLDGEIEELQQRIAGLKPNDLSNSVAPESQPQPLRRFFPRN